MTRSRPLARRRVTRSLLASAAASAIVVAVATPAQATWSIVVADPDSGQVGAAIASCVDIAPAETFAWPDGSLIPLAVVPGVGAGISQAALNMAAPDVIRESLSAGATADEIIAALTDPAFDPDAETRQHAVVTLAEPDAAAAFTGSGDEPWAGSAQGPGISAQGNILVSEAVVTDAVDAYLASTGSMQVRLAAGLLAGSRAGGDSRCGDQTALFAHVAVSQEDGTLRTFTMTVAPGDGQNPVTQLVDQIDAAEAGVATESTAEQPQEESSFGLAAVALIIGILALIGFIVGAVTTFARRRRRGQSAGEQ